MLQALSNEWNHWNMKMILWGVVISLNWYQCFRTSAMNGITETWKWDYEELWSAWTGFRPSATVLTSRVRFPTEDPDNHSIKGAYRRPTKPSPRWMHKVLYFRLASDIHTCHAEDPPDPARDEGILPPCLITELRHQGVPGHGVRHGFNNYPKLTWTS